MSQATSWKPFRFLAVVLFVAAPVTGGCASLPRGSLAAVDAPPSAARPGRVYLLRGWRDLWSDGIDQLGAEIKAEGFAAEVYQQSQAAQLGDALLRSTATRPSINAEPLVLIGFSFGADEAIRIAQRLAQSGTPVDLLVTIDPVTPPPIPASVSLAKNFYQSNGAWDVLPWLRGVPVKASAESDASRVTNINLRERSDLAESDTSHRTIAANRKLHASIVDEVRRVCAQR